MKTPNSDTRQKEVITFVQESVSGEFYDGFVREFLKYSDVPTWGEAKHSFYNIDILFTCLEYAKEGVN